MHRLDETAYGFRVGLEGFMDREAMAALLADVEQYARAARGEFGALLDLRRATAFPAEAQEILKRCVRTLREHGMGRHAVVLSSALATLQAKRLWREAAAIPWCRFLDAAVSPEWERQAVEWIEGGIEPPVT
jgi:hypothetical protein